MIITPLQIRFNDMDPMKRVNNATYSSYLELGRLDFCNKYLKIDQLEDIPFVLIRIEMDIKSSLKPLENAEVHTWVSYIGTTSWKFQYKILNPINNQIYVEAETVQVYFNYRLDKKENIPSSFRKILEKEMNLT
ncbi:MAG: acyl-CoA thioesterase [Leptospira sp.]|nr:acyl-CoA thioesterase [Leptospira sp.]